jgi:hypothetical protein
MEMCACGRPLHYTDPNNYRRVQAFVEELGPTLHVHCGGRSWLVPRHFIALHGLKASDLPALAAQYGFKEVPHE